jgi:hypothetical protein
VKLLVQAQKGTAQVFKGCGLPCLWILFFLAGCPQGNMEVLQVRKVLIDLNPEFQRNFKRVEKNDLRELLLQSLESQKRWSYNSEAADGFVLRITLDGVNRSSVKKGGTHLWILTAQLQDTAQPSNRTFSGYAAVPYDDGDELQDTFYAALNQGFEQIYSASQAVHESNESLVAWLQTSKKGAKEVSAAKKKMAIQVLGSRKSKEATTALREILLGTEPALAQEALSALTLIGDPEGLDAVFDYAERKPAPVRKKAIVAAQLMGGKYAAAWLFTMSTGHEDPSVRQLAARALDKVETALKTSPQK